jgi:hypothetical protein
VMEGKMLRNSGQLFFPVCVMERNGAPVRLQKKSR